MSGVPRILLDVVTSSEGRTTAMEIWRAANAARQRPAGELRAGRVRERIAAADLVLLARYGERPGGMLVAEQFVDGAPDPTAAHIAMVFVHPALWGCGIGTALLRSLQDREWRRLSAWFRNDNRRAQRLFSAAGFTDTGQRAHLQDGDVIEQWRWARSSG